MGNQSAAIAHNVVSIDESKLKSQHSNLVTVVDCAQWSLSANAILQAMRMPRGQLSAMEGTPLPEGSLARNLGFERVREFITTARASGGLGMEWGDWERLIRSLTYQEEYGLHNWAQEAILAAVTDVIAELGRSPSSASEFHLTRERIHQREAEKRTELMARQVEEQKSRNRNLMRGLQSARGELEQNKRHLTELEQARADSESHYQALIGKLRREHENEMLAAVEAERREVIQRYQKLIDDERASHAQAYDEVCSRMQAYKDEAENAQRGDDAESRMAADRERIRSTMARLKRAHGIVHKIRAESQRIHAQNASLIRDRRNLSERHRAEIEHRERRIRILSRRIANLNSRLARIAVQRDMLGASLIVVGALALMMGVRILL